MKKLLILIFIPFFSFAETCNKDTYMKEMELISQGYANEIEFKGVSIPIPYRYRVKPVTSPAFNFNAYSFVCIGDAFYNEKILIQSTRDCIACNATKEELDENGFEILISVKKDNLHILKIRLIERTMLLVWDNSEALLIMDQNDEYLDYVAEHFLS